MGDEKQSQSANVREQKRAQFAGAARTKSRWKFIGGLIALVAVDGYLVIVRVTDRPAAMAVKLPAPSSRNQQATQSTN